MRSRLLFLPLLIAAAVALSPPGPAAASHFPKHPPKPGYTVTIGERSRTACDAIWLLKGKRPSIYRSKRFSVYTRPLVEDRRGRCLFTKPAGLATKRVKFRLGYPAGYIRPTFGRKLRSYLVGDKRRPIACRRGKADPCKELATRRAALEIKRARQLCAGEGRLLRTARREIGVHESPWGLNCGRRVRYYQSSTGAYCAAWCVSFGQKMLQASGFSTIANRSAGVFYVVSYANRAGWLNSMPKPGRFVAFMEGSGHFGIVESVTPRGFSTIEGNANNSVMRRFYRHGSRRVLFINVPGVSRKVRCRQ